MILLIILVFLVAVAISPAAPYARGWGWGYYPSGGLGLVALILVALYLSGNLGARGCLINGRGW